MNNFEVRNRLIQIAEAAARGAFVLRFPETTFPTEDYKVREALEDIERHLSRARMGMQD